MNNTSEIPSRYQSCGNTANTRNPRLQYSAHMLQYILQSTDDKKYRMRKNLFTEEQCTCANERAAGFQENDLVASYFSEEAYFVGVLIK